MSNNLLEVIKKAAMEAVSASSPAGLVIGTVTSVSPLSVSVEDMFTLDEDFLILTKNVTDHYVDMSVSHTGEENEVNISHSHTYSGTTDSASVDNHKHSIQGSESGGETSEVVTGTTNHSHAYNGTTSQFEASSTSHSHGYKGRKKVLMHYALEAGESVLLLRVQGGQQYIVLDRIGDVPVRGEWVE